MPLKSMTGFGAARGALEGWGLHVEIKAVNHKSLDVRVNMPRGWGQLESHVLAAVRERIRRGRMTVTLDATRHSSTRLVSLGIDEARLGDVVTQLHDMIRRHDLTPELRLSDLEPYRHLYMEQEEGVSMPDWADVAPVVDDALDAFELARSEEGATIHELFDGHINRLKDAHDRLVVLRPGLLEGYAERLKQRLLEMSERHSLDLDEGRVIQEVNYFADRTDIAEELQRTGAHLDRLEELLAMGDEPHGKKLDFYLQELIRETNTMASKSNFSALTQVVVEMKSWIEQLREQAANVE